MNGVAFLLWGASCFLIGVFTGVIGILACAKTEQDADTAGGKPAKKIPEEPGEWKGVDVCKNCEAELTTQQIYHQDAVCPYCGHATSRHMCDVKRLVRRERWDDEGRHYWEYK